MAISLQVVVPSIERLVKVSGGCFQHFKRGNVGLYWLN